MDKQTSLPKLRFSEFKKVWQVDLLGNLSDKLVVGFVGTCEKYYTSKENGLPMLRTGNLKDGRLELEDLKYVTKEFHKKNVKSQLKKGDILIPRHGSNGKGVLFDCSFDANSLNFVIFRTNKLYLDSIFTVNSFYTKFLENQVTSVVAGSTQGVINTSEIGKLKIFYPSLHEQVKIAQFLTSVEEKLSLLKRKKSLLSQYKKGVMQQLFSQELRFKDEKGNDFVDWEEKKLTDLAEIIGGGTPDTLNQEFWNGEIDWFTPTELKTKYVSQSIRKITKEGLQQSSAKILPIGSVLFTSRATVGDVSLSLKECATNQGFQSFVVNERNCNEFLYYWICFNKNEFISRASGSTFLEVSKSEIQKIKVLTPSLPEQTKIATFLSALDAKIAQTSLQIEKMQTWKKGLLQQMFV